VQATLQLQCQLYTQPQLHDSRTIRDEVTTVRKQSRSGSSRCGGITTVTITCTVDGRAHDVPDVQIAGPQADRQGRYVAVCGHVVTAASMIEPEGTRCPLCAAF
jgi:hypothetical protein